MKLTDDYALAQPWWLLLLLLVPLLTFLGYRQGARSWIAYPTLRVLSTLGWKPKDKPFRFAPLLLPLFLIPAIFGMARPQATKTRTSRTASGIDIMIAIDVSESMNAADFYESGSTLRRGEMRINAAKKIIGEFIKKRPDDRIGMISFAARPYTVAPVTLDHEILTHTMNQVALIRNNSEGGTAIGSAIIASGQRLEKLRLNIDEEDKSSVASKSKIIVLVTDGASNSGTIKPKAAAEVVADLDIKIYPIAIGSPEGRLIGRGNTQEFDMSLLQEIAKITGGDCYRATNYDGFREAFKSIDELEKTEIKTHTRILRKELYPYFIAPSIILILGYLGYTAFNPPPMP